MLLLLWPPARTTTAGGSWAWPLLLVTIVLLLIPLLPFTRAIAPSLNGARRWVDIGPLNFQPSELARLAVVIWCAMLASKKGAQVREFKKGVLPFIMVLGLVSLLILLEPNLSMATLVALLGGLVLFTSGAKIGHFILLGGVAVILVFHQIRDAQYRLARVLTFLNPGDATTEAGFQIHQSLVGIGSGGLFGVGFGQGQQKLGLPARTRTPTSSSAPSARSGDSSACSSWLLLFALFCWLGFRIARTAADPFGQYLAVGLTATIGLTAFMHMAVSLGLMPTTGLTLPFMSYGRSSQVISLLGTGILINIGRLRGSARATGGRERGAVGATERENSVELLLGAPAAKAPEVLRPKVDGRLDDERYRTGLTTAPTYSPHRRRRNRRPPDAGARDRRGAQGARSARRAGARRRDCAGWRPACSPAAISGSTCCPPSRSTAAPGGKTSAGRSSRAGCCARWAGCSSASGRWLCSELEATPRGRWSGGQRGTASRPQSRSRTPIPGSPRRLAEPAGPPRLPGSSRSAPLLRFGAETEVFDTGNPNRPANAGATSDGARARFGLDGHAPGRARDRRQPGRARDQPRPSPAGWMPAGPADRGPALGDRPRHL